MAIFGKPYSNEMLVTSDESPRAGYVRIFEDKERPTPNHICSPDGIWIIPKRTAEDVERERAQRYAAETDELKRHYEADVLLGKPASETEPKLAAWREKVNQIKKELPFPEPDSVMSHYRALTPPTEVIEN